MLHLYHKSKTSNQVKETLDAFKFCDSVDISKVSNVRDDDVYIVEIDKSKKELLLQIRKLLLNKQNRLIYFFINDSSSLILFQLASLLNVGNVVTKKSDIHNVILNIKKDILDFENLKLKKNILQILENEQYFLVYKDDKLKFASQKIYDDFNFEDILEVESKLHSLMDLKNNSTFTLNQQKYNTTAKRIDSTGENFIFIENISQNISKDVLGIDFVKNRIYFIEVLKEKMLQKNISTSELGIITIQIENISNLKNDWSEYDIEIAVRDLLLHIKINIESHILFAQYDNGLYLTLFENLDFKELKEEALLIQKKISEYTQTKKIKPIISLYAFDINDLELNKILEIISHVAVEEITSKDIQTQKLHRILNLDVGLDDERVIDIFLQTAFINKASIKLLNIYKGLCINTSSEIVKKTDQEIYVKFELLQGIAMQFEGSTVIQSSSLSKDILADINYLDSKKQLVQLKNFRFVQGNANSRKYSRVTCSVRTPISFSHKKETLNGEILDISMNSIALKVRVHSNIEQIKGEAVILNFTLPVKSSEEDFSRLSLSAKVIIFNCGEEYCKVIVHLDEDQSSEPILMEYVYNRQKEIIIELKKQTTLLT